MKLRELAKIRSGLVLARKESRQPSKHKYSLMNLRSIEQDGTIDVRKLDVFAAVERLADDYLAQVGDVIVRLSVPYTAVLIDRSTKGVVIPSNFVIIRTDTAKLLPEFLFWYLNRARIKREIYENSAGNMLAAIKPSYFGEIEVPEIGLREQKQIADIHGTARREVRLLRDLADAKEKYYEGVLDGALRGVPARG
jgi:restriction endonuclease S subunit